MNKIVLLDKKTLGNANTNIFSKYGIFESYETTPKELTAQRLKGATIAITNKVIIDKTIIDACPDLKLICVSATGMNNIDLDYAKISGISVKNVSGYSTDSVVQHTFAMAFYLIGHIRYYDNYVKNKEWAKSDTFVHLGEPYWQISKKRWGIIGLGTIGKKVASIAKSFGCEVVYYSTSGKNNDLNFERLELEVLLKTSNIISIHSPLNEVTKNLIDFDKLSLMKKGSIILNLGRGGIINEADLSRAIDELEIMAATDVLESEPMSLDSPFFEVKNKNRLLITPHLAWASSESIDNLIDGVCKNIEEFLDASVAI